MSRNLLLAGVLFGLFLALAFFLDARYVPTDWHGLRMGLCVFVFATYAGIVAFGSDPPKRTPRLPLYVQTLLGVLTACVIAVLCNAPPIGYVAAVLLGVILGFTADHWVRIAIRILLPGAK